MGLIWLECFVQNVEFQNATKMYLHLNEKCCNLIAEILQKYCREKILRTAMFRKPDESLLDGAAPFVRLTYRDQRMVFVMKLLTLNTHSLQEENYSEKLALFIQSILREKPDIIALQEVSQTCREALMPADMLEGQYPVPGCMNITRDNHAANIAFRLRQAGIECYWAWLPIKLGWNKYDEGVAILSLGRKIRCIDQFPISKSADYQNWRTRAVLGVQVEGLEDWFYCLHMGWWSEEADGFLNQWRILNSCIAAKRICGPVWLLGDFNAPDTVSGESYAQITAGGWIDTYRAARERDSGITVPGPIDGWREKATPKGMRLDYIWCSEKRHILSSRVMFDGKLEPVVSDHYGVLIEVREDL